MAFRFNISRHGRLAGVAFAACLLIASHPAVAHADTQTELAAARAQLEAIGAEADRINDELSALTEQLEVTQSEIGFKELEIADRQDMLSEYVSSEYKYGFTDLLQMVFSSTSFDELVSRVTYINKVSMAQATTISEVKALKEELSQKQAEQQENVNAAQEQVEALNAQRTAASQLVNSLDAQLQEELRAEAERNAAIQRALEEAEADHAQDVENAPATPPQTPDPEPEAPSAPQGGGQQPADPPANSQGEAIAARARAQLGKPYVWAACGPDAFDCSGLVSYAITGRYGYRLGNSETMRDWPSVSNPQPGDILYRYGHVGVYVGGGMMVHASSPSTGVILSPVPSNMRYVRYPG